MRPEVAGGRRQPGIGLVEVLLALVIITMALLPALGLHSSMRDEVRDSEGFLVLLQMVTRPPGPGEAGPDAGGNWPISVQDHRVQESGRVLVLHEKQVDPDGSYAPRPASMAGGL